MIGKRSWSECKPKIYAVLEASVSGLTVRSLVRVSWVINTFNVTPLTFSREGTRPLNEDQNYMWN